MVKSKKKPLLSQRSRKIISKKKSDNKTRSTSSDDRSRVSSPGSSSSSQMKKERERLFNFSMDMLCIAGFDGFFKRVSPSFEKTLGWTSKELLSKPIAEFIHPQDRAQTLNAIQTHETGADAVQFENRYMCKDGSYRWLSWNAHPLIDEGLIIGVGRDITELKHLQDEREKIIQELQDALVKVKTLTGLLPICSWCKKIRNDQGYWEQVEQYLADHSFVSFTHGICPECFLQYSKEVAALKKQE